MTDAVRALLQRLDSHIAMMAPHQRDREAGKLLIEARAALSEQPAPKVCKGIPRVGCSYFAQCDSVCNKCGKVHAAHLIPATLPAPVERVALSDEQIDAAIGKPLDDLLDHIYEYGTAAEGIKERARRIARAVIAEYERANGIGKGDQA